MVWAAAPAKPVIGAATAVPAKPQATKPFTVSFKVRSSTLQSADHRADGEHASAGGGRSRHKQSFRGGTARVSLVVPVAANGKPLRVTVTIRSGGQAATKTVTYPCRRCRSRPLRSQAPRLRKETRARHCPARRRFPRRRRCRSRSRTRPPRERRTGAADFTAANGTVTFAPGETSRRSRSPSSATPLRAGRDVHRRSVESGQCDHRYRVCDRHDPERRPGRTARPLCGQGLAERDVELRRHPRRSRAGQPHQRPDQHELFVRGPDRRQHVRRQLPVEDHLPDRPGRQLLRVRELHGRTGHHLGRLHHRRQVHEQHHDRELEREMELHLPGIPDRLRDRGSAPSTATRTG